MVALSQRWRVDMDLRRKAYGGLMRREDLDGIIVTHLPDIRYLCGFSGSSGMVLLTQRGKGYFFTDFRYREQSALEVYGVRPVVYETSPEEAAARVLRRHHTLKLGFDPAYLSYAGVLSLRRHIKDHASLIPLKGSLMALRARKSGGELQIIRQGIELAETAFVKALGEMDAGTTEADLAASIDTAARRAGAEAPSFETIVAAGPRGALVHASPSGRRLRGPAVVDWGVVYKGYCTDTTRTVAFGRVPQELRKAHRLVLEAQEKALERVRPGVKARDVDRAAREVIEKAGYGAAFGHGFGHGVGLEIHERPYVGKTGGDIIEEGMVFTAEPGIYLPGKGGVRVEDMLLVTADGAEYLTTLPRSLDPGDYL